MHARGRARERGRDTKGPWPAGSTGWMDGWNTHDASDSSAQACRLGWRRLGKHGSCKWGALHCTGLVHVCGCLGSGAASLQSSAGALGHGPLVHCSAFCKTFLGLQCIAPVASHADQSINQRHGWTQRAPAACWPGLCVCGGGGIPRAAGRCGHALPMHCRCSSTGGRPAVVLRSHRWPWPPC